MSQDSKIKAGFVRHLLNEGYDRKFICDLLNKWKSENVSVKDGIIKLLEKNEENQNLYKLSITLQNYQIWL